MSIFGGDYTPTPAERLREGAGWVLLLVFAGGFVWLTSWLDDMGGLRVGLWWWLPFLLLAPVLMNWPRVTAWLERGRAIESGEWRTTRAVRISACCSALAIGGYGCSLPFQVHQAWTLGDMPRFVGAAIGTAAWSALIIAIFVRRTRAVLELAIDEVGVFTVEWRGVVPWAAIDFVRAPRETDDALRLVLKPDALDGLPEFVRRRNGFLDLKLAATALTPAAAVDALRAAHPDLEIRSPRSAGVVLPVRGATDIVEADL